MAILYRAVSQAEYDDYMATNRFRTADNTLEAKQFFKSRVAVLEFVRSSVQQHYRPPYKRLLIITSDDKQLQRIHADTMDLDGFEALSVPEEQLAAFNNCITL